MSAKKIKLLRQKWPKGTRLYGIFKVSNRVNLKVLITRKKLTIEMIDVNELIVVIILQYNVSHSAVYTLTYSVVC